MLPHLGLHSGLQLLQLLHPAPMGPGEAPPTLHVLSQASLTATTDLFPRPLTRSTGQSGPHMSIARCGGGSAGRTSCMPSSVQRRMGLVRPLTHLLTMNLATLHGVCRHFWHSVRAQCHHLDCCTDPPTLGSRARRPGAPWGIPPGSKVLKLVDLVRPQLAGNLPMGRGEGLELCTHPGCLLGYCYHGHLLRTPPPFRRCHEVVLVPGASPAQGSMLHPMACSL